jgi:DNA-binding NarL/FixJ family response regulator/Flp pilus assembly pilin Flp
MASQPIRILIAEDHPLFAQGLRRVLTLEPDLEVVDEVHDGEAAIARVQELQPDVVLMDINMPKVNGLQATQEIKAANEDVAVIILTAYDDEEQMIFALRTGASAYFVKDVLPSELIDAIRAVRSGQYVVHGQVLAGTAELMAWLLAWYNERTRFDAGTQGTLMPLSAREMTVLEMIVRGASNKIIANTLGISHQTVKNHMTSIFRKLAVNDRTEAAVIALRRGWIRLQDAGTLLEETHQGQTMQNKPSHESENGQSFVEYALILLLIAIVVLAIFLIMGDEIRNFVNDLLQAWFPS